MRYALAALLLVMLGCSGSATPPAKSATTQPAAAPSTGSYDDTEIAGVTPAARVNLNTTSEDGFKALPGVSDKMAHEFVEYQPYVSIRQFRKEMSKYVDDETIAAFEKLVFVPIDVNECDAETLAQIPGVDMEKAEALVAGRPYASDDAFIDALGFDELQAATARTYLASP
jgi:DNA uptake protein ComE-like DNA-binding protein